MMSVSKRLIWLPFLMLAAAAHGQEGTLTVRNGGETVTLTMSDLERMPPSRLSAEQADRGEYEGVVLQEVLKRVGVTFGQTLRGPRPATHLLATGADGYRVVVALPELDPDFSRHPGALVAFRQNGQRLSPRDRPLQLVLPGDKRHARWVRSLTSLHVLTAPEVK